METSPHTVTAAADWTYPSPWAGVKWMPARPRVDLTGLGAVLWSMILATLITVITGVLADVAARMGG